MKKSIKTIALAIIFTFAFAAPILSVVSPAAPAAVAASRSCSDDDNLLGMPAWYRGIINSDCSVQGPDPDKGGLSAYIWKIVLNILQMGLVLLVYVAVFFILYGGFQFIVGGSNPSMIEKARKTLLNSVIGLIVGIGSVAILNMLFKGIFGESAGQTSNGVEGLIKLEGEDLLTNALNLTYFVAGTVSVVVIIVAGILYTVSSGDLNRVSKAKNLLTYAIIGLIVVVSAFTITAFVTGRFAS